MRWVSREVATNHLCCIMTYLDFKNEYERVSSVILTAAAIFSGADISGDGEYLFLWAPKRVLRVVISKAPLFINREFERYVPLDRALRPLLQTSF
jgi:hypothetical protein